ncbi:hypothetical protein BDN72DRAFT_653107 [Pluteus cervinus]|uniref:Uncharacterized protein n=1 Tax=Pluteus cervinus TaxID=181527 RepID=A0ACD3AS15_9AGAR|nr:hypothetical protein BDN72DRAFT_653107 [Pluteus cervinus]
MGDVQHVVVMARSEITLWHCPARAIYPRIRIEVFGVPPSISPQTPMPMPSMLPQTHIPSMLPQTSMPSMLPRTALTHFVSMGALASVHCLTPIPPPNYHFNNTDKLSNLRDIVLGIIRCIAATADSVPVIGQAAGIILQVFGIVEVGTSYSVFISFPLHS